MVVLRSSALEHQATLHPNAEASRVLPDPILTANLYCHAALDKVVAYAIVPFRETLRAQGLSNVSLWLLRYRKGGEHLKIRIHGPLEHRTTLQRWLQIHTEAAWAQIPPSVAERTSSRNGAPPVDEEDATSENYYDRTLLWTHYRRSIVSLGRGDFLENDHYVALLTACLAAGSDRVLDVFQEHGALVSLNKKQRALLALFVEALAILDEPAEVMERYLIYHRDSLLRFLLAAADKPEDRATELLARYEEHLAKIQDPHQALPLYMTKAQSHSSETQTVWQQKIVAFCEWTSNPQNRFCRCDPFAWDPCFTPIFTILHGVSNQLGISFFNEGFLCHLLLATMGAKRPRVEFYPNWAWAKS